MCWFLNKDFIPSSKIQSYGPSKLVDKRELKKSPIEHAHVGEAQPRLQGPHCEP